MSQKVVLEAGPTGLGDSKRAAGSQWDHLGENFVLGGPTGGNRVYTRNRRRAKKFIPAKPNRYSKRGDVDTTLIRDQLRTGFLLNPC